MYETALRREAAAMFDGIHGGEMVRAEIMPLWMIFEAYLQESGTLPKRLEEVPQSCFPSFISRCEESGMGDDRLHLMVAGIRMILARSGWKPARLAGLVAPRRRVRIANDATGRYQFALVPKERKCPPQG